MNDRHPWTHAADFIRQLGPISGKGVVLSRDDCSPIIDGIAKALNISNEELAIKLSEAEQAKTQEDLDKQTDRFMREMLPHLQGKY